MGESGNRVRKRVGRSQELVGPSQEQVGSCQEIHGCDVVSQETALERQEQRVGEL